MYTYKRILCVAYVTCNLVIRYSRQKRTELEGNIYRICLVLSLMKMFLCLIVSKIVLRKLTPTVMQLPSE